MTTRKGEVRIGISGWRYAPWRGVFYPKSLPQRSELHYASRQFPTIELNGSFYSLQRPEHYALWYEQTPPDFVFAVKGSRYITHIRRLREVEIPLAASSLRACSTCARSSARCCGSSRRTCASTKRASRPSSTCCRAAPARRCGWRGGGRRR